jgi:sugar phosphate isomerase/epimerase
MNGIKDNQEQPRGVIKHRKTEEYYKGEGKWTPDEEDAMEFDSLSRVAEEAQRYGIKDCCEFIMKLAALPGFLVLLPL